MEFLKNKPENLDTHETHANWGYYRKVESKIFSLLPECNLIYSAAAKSLQSCPTLCDPIEGSPPRSPIPAWDSPGKNTGVGCHFLLQCMKVKSESEVASHVRLLATPWTAAHQAGSSVHGVFQARVLEWGAIAFSVNIL